MKYPISSVLHKIFAKKNYSFILHDKEIKLSELVSEKGLLPIIAHQADNLAMICLGFGIGISLENADNSTLGTMVIFDEVTPYTIKLLFLYDVMVQIIENNLSDDGKVVLDEVMY